MKTIDPPPPPSSPLMRKVSPGSPRGRPHVGTCEAVQHVHQGCLARPVLAEESVDLTGSHRQVNVVIGDETAEALRDSPQLELHRRLPPMAARPGSPGRAMCRQLTPV